MRQHDIGAMMRRRDIGATMSQIMRSLNTRVTLLETELGAPGCGDPKEIRKVELEGKKRVRGPVSESLRAFILETVPSSWDVEENYQFNPKRDIPNVGVRVGDTGYHLYFASPLRATNLCNMTCQWRQGEAKSRIVNEPCVDEEHLRRTVNGAMGMIRTWEEEFVPVLEDAGYAPMGRGACTKRFDSVSHIFVGSLFPGCNAVLLRWWPKEEGRTYQLEERSLPDVVIEGVDQLKEVLRKLQRDPAAILE